ncbi:MAG TPA: OmpA family protein [Vicinamibacterales bacterium]|nr:OmpA family protein [Vicinamibacterales bacterium]
MRNRILKTASLLALCIPSLVLAQHQRGKGTWEWNAGGGIKLMDRHLMDFLASGPVANRFTDDVDPGRLMPAVALRGGYSVTRTLAFSLAGEAAQGSGILFLTPLVALTYSPNINAKTSPFVTIGSQFTRIDGQNERLMHPTWGAHVGVGIRQMIADRLALRVEGRVASEHYAELPGKKSAFPGIATVGLSYFRGASPGPVLMASGGEVERIRWRTDTLRIVRVDTVRSVSFESADQVVLRVQFKTNFAELLPISRPVLDTVAMAIRETPGSRWEVQGHTDNVGTPAQNKYLSDERAKTVVQYLVSKGVDPGILTAVGFGEERPVFSNSTDYGRAQNRRVQLRRIPPPPKGPAVP